MKTSTLIQQKTQQFGPMFLSGFRHHKVLTVRWPFEVKVVILDLQLFSDSVPPYYLHFLEHYLLRANRKLLQKIYFVGGTCKAFSTQHAIQFTFILPPEFSLDIEEFLSQCCSPEAWESETKVLRAEIDRYQKIKNLNLLGSPEDLDAIAQDDLEAIRNQACLDCCVLEADLADSGQLLLCELAGSIQSSPIENDRVLQGFLLGLYGPEWDGKNADIFAMETVKHDISLALEQPFSVIQLLMGYLRDGSS
ncbi:hypothetical protein [Corynebacterium freiburgense]|uniref:hypothetical protein n=1 Tax=Corynebacterium freiburgense TaxID=556548 RepID=UPI000428DBF6|nr:hypothetical protein [Corynebacterium freiburgense]WJZ03420.1 hypothetical protein CFREI_10740 [Corynebacterium freiburgense]